MNTVNTRFGKDKISEMMSRVRTVFFVGIGGINMSSLAAITSSLGYNVKGSDRTRSPETDGLEAHGVTVYHTHDAKNVDGADALVYTVSIPDDNPEYVRAGELGIPRISRADYLGWLMSGSRVRVDVSGMHGKSTVTCMCASVMLAADCDPTISSGAVVHELGCTYRAGGRDYFLFESCEYKDSFLSFYPTHAAILNIEMDHPDYFRDVEQVKESFRRYMERISDTAVVNWSDGNVREVAEASSCPRIVKFGTSADEDLCPRDEYDYFADTIAMDRHGSSFMLHTPTGDLEIKIAEVGIHNVRDAVAAAALSLEAGMEPAAVAAGLASFKGAARRMELIGNTASGAEVYVDYAHHPTEINATLGAARMMAGGRLFVIFQPHTYTRTRELFGEFARSLSMADEVVVANIYAARETNIYGVSSEMLAAEINRDGSCAVWSGSISGEGDEFARAAAYAKERVSRGDAVIVMGAGDIIKAVPYLCAK